MLRVAFIFVVLWLVSSVANSKSPLFTEIEKDKLNQWSVTYSSQKPIKSIMFASSPDNSRLTRWLPLTDGFFINKINGNEIITRKDGQAFHRVQLALTPTYTHLPKSYAPFSPYSNNGMLIHSGRFFACPEICTGNENLWALSVKAPMNERIVVNGEVHQNSVSWWDNNEGRKVYIGQQQLNEHEHYISIIDSQLSSEIKTKLEHLFPKMMTRLATTYGELSEKPMLFASYGQTDTGAYGHQGGTLPNQVFMHWWGAENTPKNGNEELIWFFAHEAAHIYQNLSGGALNPVDNWLHEGHAEATAKTIMLEMFPQYADYINAKSNKAKRACEKIISNSSLSAQVTKNNHNALYYCGLYIFEHIEKIHHSSDTTAEIWKQFVKTYNGSNKSPSELFLHQAETRFALPKQTANIYRRLVSY